MTLVPKSNTTSITLTNRSCESNFSHSILNCFPNNTCQMFVDAPLTYTLKPTPKALLYFPRKIFPDASRCCMLNTTDLMNRSTDITSTNGSVINPRCLVIDNHGYLVTVSSTPKSIVRFHSNNLTQIDRSPSSLLHASPLALAYRNEAYYVGFDCYILVVDSTNMTLMHNISTSALNGTRDMIFLNDGQQMIVTATYSNSLVFFNRSSLTSHNYDFIGYQNVSCHSPHGLFYVNDSLFYLTSWSNSTVYKYSNVGNGTAWSEALAITASPLAPVTSGNHIFIDDCGRYWLSLGAGGVQIFDREGLRIDSLYSTRSNIFDTLVLDNYVMYLSDSAGNRILRVDPNVPC